MRFLMLAAAISLTSLVTPNTADACGGYDSGPRAPTLFLVTTHGEHSFVVLNHAVGDSSHPWRVLDRRSYDQSAIAPAPAATAPIVLTLLGPGGAKPLRTQHQVFLRDALHHDRQPTLALPISGRDDVRVAALGTVEGLSWRDVKHVDRNNAGAWANDVGSGFASRERDAQMFTFYNPTRKAFDTTIRVGETPFGTYAGSPLGTITSEGIRYAVLAEGNALRTISLGPV